MAVFTFPYMSAHTLSQGFIFIFLPLIDSTFHLSTNKNPRPTLLHEVISFLPEMPMALFNILTILQKFMTYYSYLFSWYIFTGFLLTLKAIVVTQTTRCLPSLLRSLVEKASKHEKSN